jgi:coenzyme PQQ precursor peptide PqqA
MSRALAGGSGGDQNSFIVRRSKCLALCSNLRRFTMQWTAPQATDLRFGFEITMYISAR